MKDVYISLPLRSPTGKFGGSLKDIPATKIAGAIVKKILEETKIPNDVFDDVIFGNVLLTGEKMNPARQAAIFGGVSETVPAMTINRVCGSGLQAIVSATMEIQSGYASSIIAGGMENMDQAPYILPNARYGFRLGDTKLYDEILLDGLNDAFTNKHSGLITDEYLVPKYGITRAQQDEFAYESHMKAAKAINDGKFKSQIVPITLPNGNVFDTDETVRPDTTIEKLSTLKPAFKEGGTITAGNAPSLNSGAASMIISDEDAVKKYNLPVFGRVVSYAISAVDPNFFGIAPVFAIRKALGLAGLEINDIDLFEINEAFAAIALAIQKELNIPREKLNVNGGAIALGHPIGATGAILTTKILHELKLRNAKYGLVSLCIGGGQGIAVIFERV
ncbi:thiolase family protein [Caldisericum sp. AR60]|uniref:thiolase family protein n=1 Tax=Caldisericum sp. AR60 TaxID=3397852 RepID=UPI0039FBA45D